jgi:hypothetical protein
VFARPGPPPPSDASSSSSRGSTRSAPRTQPLTTLLYLFNTLDLELVHAPLLERVWPRVEALYVHGLRLHVRTGAGMDFGRHMVVDPGTQSGIDTIASGDRSSEVGLLGARLRLLTGLKRCYVIVGSWGTPLHRRHQRRTTNRAENREGEGRKLREVGVRHVDFVRHARSRWKAQVRMHADCDTRARGSGNPGLWALPPSSSRSVSLTFTPSTSLMSPTVNSSPHVYVRQRPSTSPLIFRRPRVRPPNFQSTGRESDYDGDSEDTFSDFTEGGYVSSHEEDHVDVCVTESTTSSSRPGPFLVRIPQVAWSSSLHGGRGGYFVAKSVEESVAVWRARRGASASAGGSEGDESASTDESDFEDGKEVDTMLQKWKGVQCRYRLKSLFSIRARASGPSLTS